MCNHALSASSCHMSNSSENTGTLNFALDGLSHLPHSLPSSLSPPLLLTIPRLALLSFPPNSRMHQIPKIAQSLLQPYHTAQQAHRVHQRSVFTALNVIGAVKQHHKNYIQVFTEYAAYQSDQSLTNKSSSAVSSIVLSVIIACTISTD